MTIPDYLIDSVKAASASVTSRSDHALSPHFRHAIYQTLVRLGRPNALGWLGISTARYVLPIWRSVRPEDSLAERSIETANLWLRGSGDGRAANEFAGQAWESLDKLGAKVSDQNAKRALFAGEASVAALYEALGRDPFRDIKIGADETDADLDPWCSDTALWAAAAY